MFHAKTRALQHAGQSLRDLLVLGIASLGANEVDIETIGKAGLGKQLPALLRIKLVGPYALHIITLGPLMQRLVGDNSIALDNVLDNYVSVDRMRYRLAYTHILQRRLNAMRKPNVKNPCTTHELDTCIWCRLEFFDVLRRHLVDQFNLAFE